MDMKNWKWLNKSQIINEGGEVVIYAPAETDWFNNPVPEDGKLSAPVANAPFYYTEVTGDFVFRAKVRPNFRTVYDACALMVIQDEHLWTKAAFEKSDFGTTAAVCVVTNGISDDANGCNIEQEEVWLYYIVLTASKNSIRSRIEARGDTWLIDRALFLKDKLEHTPENQGYLLDNTNQLPQETIKKIDLDKFRIII